MQCERGGVSACLGWAPAISVRGRAGLCMPCASWRALALANVTVGFSRVLCAFVTFGHFRRAGMSYRVNAYSLSGGGSIDWVPGVVPAAWGGPRRARRAVRAAPKTRNCTHTRVNPTSCGVLLEDDHPKHLQRAADLCETSLTTWRRERREARADRARRKCRASALLPRACSWRPRGG